jgi:hypothetical protein
MSILGVLFSAMILSLITALCLPNLYGLAIVLIICALAGIPLRSLAIKKYIEICTRVKK